MDRGESFQEAWEFGSPFARAPHLKELRPSRPQSSQKSSGLRGVERPAGGRRLVEVDGKRELKTATSLRYDSGLTQEAFKDECMSILRDEAVYKRGTSSTQIWGDLVSAEVYKNATAHVFHGILFLFVEA